MILPARTNASEPHTAAQSEQHQAGENRLRPRCLTGARFGQVGSDQDAIGHRQAADVGPAQRAATTQRPAQRNQ